MTSDVAPPSAAATGRRLPVPRAAGEGWLHLPLVALAGWALTLLLIPSPLVVGPIGAPGRPAGLVGLGLLVWWALGVVSGRSEVRGLSAARLAVGVLVATVLASYTNGMASGWWAPLSVRQSTDELWTLLAPDVESTTTTMITAADRGLLALAAWAGVVLVAAETTRRWRDVELLTGWLAGLGAVVGALAVYEFATGSSVSSWLRIPGLVANTDLSSVAARSVLNRVSATAVHPIELGVVLACLFPLALHRLLFRRRLVDAAVCGLVGLGALLSVSRSAIVCLVAAGLVVWVTWPTRWKLRSLLLAPVVAVAVRQAVPGLLGTIRSLFSNALVDPSVTGRTADYGVILGLYGHHPWLGRGLFTFVPRNYRILDNQWLMLLVELGAVGVLAVLVLLAVTTVTVLRARARTVDVERRHLVTSLLAGVVGWTLAMATFDSWTFPMAAGTGFVLVGLCLGLARLSRTDPDPAAVARGLVPGVEPGPPDQRARAAR